MTSLPSSKQVLTSSLIQHLTEHLMEQMALRGLTLTTHEPSWLEKYTAFAQVFVGCE